MSWDIPRALYRAFGGAAAVLVLLHVIGTIGYRIIGGPQYSWLDCLYMTFITIATIGYAEVVDVSHSPAGRVFTMLIGAAGIGTVYYSLAKMTMFLVAGEVDVALRRRKMLNKIEALNAHYIVCGVGRVGSNVANELAVTQRPYVAVDLHERQLDAHRERHPEACVLQGDASEDEVLRRAGIARAAGVFAITGDDSRNLVIALSARQLNPGARIVARCHEVNYIEKMRRVGADAIVSPDFTGGMRIASSMIRPHVVSFLDEMLRTDQGLRVEEVHVPPTFRGGNVGSLALRGPDYVLLAVRDGGSWVFNPQDAYEVKPGSALVFMAGPAGRKALEQRFTA